MKVYNETSNIELTEQLNMAVGEVRETSKFRVASYVNEKAAYLNKYMKKCGLDTCVVAVSGGVDSAIVLALINHASKMEGSPIKEIKPVMLPAHGNVGVTGQLMAGMRGKQLCDELDLYGYTLDINPAVEVIRETVEPALGLKTDNWVIGQLCPYTRTPFLYYITSILNVAGYKAILVGTTNRDEGAYLGYVGKASDGMVDVQLISDIHKSQVYRVAKHLWVTQSIIEVTPTGDMYDNRTDTEVFGAPYDFVELYLNYLNWSVETKQLFYINLNEESREQFDILAKNIENLHSYNRHKYIAHSPAVHLDLWDSSCPGGWINYYEITKAFMDEE